MSARVIVLLSAALLTVSCGGGDKHLPSSNPPEYDPKKVYTTPAAPTSPLPSVARPAKPTELELLRSKLDSLETGQKATGEGKKVPFDPNLLQLFKGVTNPLRSVISTRTTTQPAQCEIRIQGTGTTTLHVNGGSIKLDPEPFAVNLIILPGRSGEVAETHCSSGNTPEKLKELFASQGVQGGEAHGMTEGGGWSSAFNVTRFRTFKWTPGKQGYEIGGWTPIRDSDVIAKKTMMVNCSIGLSACREETTLTLRLADEPGATASPPR